MRIKYKPQDFRVRELLVDDYLTPKGRWRVYRVTKKKLTSFEAARELANLARVEPAEVGLAGLKDRQGVTTQYMSVTGGRPVRWRSNDLTIEPIGYADGPVTSACSLGNAFTVTLRRVSQRAHETLASGLAHVREHGVVNYFGEQRFGNLRFGQGWVARDLALGEHEAALKALLCGHSEQDDARHAEFKRLLELRWGDWRACRDIAGKFGQHHSVFEQLARDPEDFLGGLRRVAARLRLIHLYAWQSHVWNRAVARLIAETTPPKERIVVTALEGPLFFARGAHPAEAEFENRFRLPGAGLEDVERPRERELLAAVLALEGLKPEQFRIDGVGGFQLKGEDRELVIRPRRMAVDRDGDDPGCSVLRFELPRGSYATVVVARLLGRMPEVFDAAAALEAAGERAQERAEDEANERDLHEWPDEAPRPRHARGADRDAPARGESDARRRPGPGRDRHARDARAPRSFQGDARAHAPRATRGMDERGATSRPRDARERDPARRHGPAHAGAHDRAAPHAKGARGESAKPRDAAGAPSRRVRESPEGADAAARVGEFERDARPRKRPRSKKSDVGRPRGKRRPVREAQPTTPLVRPKRPPRPKPATDSSTPDAGGADGA